MPALLLPVALVAYVVGVFLSSLGTFYRFELARKSASVVFVLAWLAHLGAVVRRGLVTGQFPLTNIGEYLLLLGLAVMTLYLLLWFRWRVEVAGILLPPIVAAAGFGALAFLGATAAVPEARPQSWFLLHTTASTLGMAALVVALAMSLIYLFQDRALKARRTLKILQRLPPLHRCDYIGFQALAVGFALLTAGIAAGVVVNAFTHHRLWVPGVKQSLPMVAWLVFAGILVARLKLGIRGRKSAYLMIAGVVLGLLSIAGMTL